MQEKLHILIKKSEKVSFELLTLSTELFTV